MLIFFWGGGECFLPISGRHHGNLPEKKKNGDIFFLKLEPSSFPLMYRYCF